MIQIKKPPFWIKNVLEDKNVVIISIATSGLSTQKGGRIINIDAIKLDNEKIIDSFQSLVNSETVITKKITKMTGITQEQNQSAPIFQEVFQKLQAFVQNATIILHNQNFTWERFLSQYFLKTGVVLKNCIIDVAKLYRFLYPSETKTNINAICDTLNLKKSNEIDLHEHTLTVGRAYVIMRRTVLRNREIYLEQVFDSPKQKNADNLANLNIRINRICYWEQVEKKCDIKRIYVTTSDGDAYYDVNHNAWTNVTFSHTVDFNALEQLCVDFLGVNTLENFRQYRGKKAKRILRKSIV